MSNPIKYSTGSETLALKKGNFYIGTGDVGKGPTNVTGYYNGITPPTGGYTIYLNKETGGPSIYTASNDAQLISLTNTIAGTSYTTANECLVYFDSQTDKVVLNRDYEGIVTDGLILNLDAGFTPSYPQSGTTWYDVGGSNNGTLINGPTFNSGNGGSIVFDGTDDFVSINTKISNSTTNTVVIWMKTSDSLLLWMQGNDNGAFYLGATYPSVNWYGGNVGPVTYYVDLNVSTNPHTEGVLNGQYHMFEAKNVNLSNWNSFRFYSYLQDRNFTINGTISITQIYNRNLTSQESLQNYNAQKGRFGL